ncbi:MAG: hypothetical protein BWZ10_03433 [candidate division BRC1 bacterium ADurb.BinA364]|nr:MAG: hypothetical protein BWZ10_03433 [candidate division BRC1 bacterium ADurb.BinA364]
MATVSSEVFNPRMISTNGRSWTGMEKCMPTIFCGRLVHSANSVMDSDEVLEMKICSGGIWRSRLSKTSCFCSR